MSKKFSLKLARNAEEVVSKCKGMAQKNGINLTGDSHSGQFNGKGIEGSYEIDGEILTIIIEKKPIFLGWPLIEAKVKDLFV
ncbi:MAG: hypothetical protein PHE55_00175 [Methylococcaceae bacterium]|nr:hypothetical protein [Methylococcaceae bacterium]